MTRKTFEGKPPMTIWSNDQSIFFDDGYLPMSPDATSLPNITAVRLIAEQIQLVIVHHRSGTVDCLQDQ